MAKAIMIQGTMSNAGKSLVAAGLCRIFKQDGYKVAPFKAQNMALNSFITKEGLEMGRAQVTQAEAAGVEPSVRMNPILLKPTNDTSSQVIVNGEVWENMSAQTYYRNKKVLVPEVKKAYDALAEEYDIIVLEGAGSPVEINLKENDIVNMFMAKLADAPVLLVGDIDRGGVFASLVGTMTLFCEEERDLVKAVIINKFRGDPAILQPGLEQLSEWIDTPVAGVIPYMHLDIEDEDSLTERFEHKGSSGIVDLAVIRLPRISNFTDFHVLESIPEVSLRYVKSVRELGMPDLILLPGTKNTMEDLLWMRQNGLEAAVLKYAASGKPVFGICGGYQMMGQQLADPHHVEHGGTLNGMGLLPGVTVFSREKTKTRVTGTFGQVQGIFSSLSGQTFAGYEIHMGETTWQGAASPEDGAQSCEAKDMQTKGLAEIQEEGKVAKTDGLSAGNCYGTYVHGIFDCEQIAGSVISALLREKGYSEDAVVTVDRKAYKEQQYDLLAQVMRENLDMELIYRILEQGTCFEKKQQNGALSE